MAIVLFVVGTVAGTLNVIAGGGSLLTVPVMIFLGLPPTVANGTNRVAILVQNVGALWSFSRHRVVEWSWLRLAAVPAFFGAALGTWLAVRIPDETFQRILAVLMVIIALWTVWNPLKRVEVGTTLRWAGDRRGRLLLAAAFFGVGVYGGFIQAGVGIFMLAGLVLGAGFTLVNANAVKNLIVLVFTVAALLVFVLNDQVRWGLGLMLGLGQAAGAWVAVRMAVERGAAFVRWVVVVIIVLAAGALLAGVGS
jgi:uncharacterized membrane protein YfcA